MTARQIVLQQIADLSEDDAHALAQWIDGITTDDVEPLDNVKDAEAAFGSHRSLTQSTAFRFVRPSRRAEADRRKEEG